MKTEETGRGEFEEDEQVEETIEEEEAPVWVSVCTISAPDDIISAIPRTTCRFQRAHFL